MEVVPVRPNKGLIGFATVEIDNQIVLHSIGIHTRQAGGEDFILFHPTAPELSRAIEMLVVEKAQEIFES